MKSLVVAERPERTNRKELARLFLKLGITAFGGPAAHIAMMQKEVVEKRRWMDHQHFLDLIGATNLIPGPNSTEMAIHIGHERGGWKGLLIAGVCFILPAVLITGFIAWLYQRYGQLPQVTQFIYGIKPAIIAIILAAALPLARRALKTAELAVIGLLSLAAALAGINEIYVMFGAGLVVLVLYVIRKEGPAEGPENFLPFFIVQQFFLLRPQSEAVPDLSEDRSHSLWQRLCTVCIPGQGAGGKGITDPVTAGGCHRGGAVHPGTGILFRHFHRLADEWMAGGRPGDDCDLPAIISIGSPAKSAGAADAEIGPVWCFPGWGQRRIDRYHRNSMCQLWQGKSYRMENHSYCFAERDSELCLAKSEYGMGGGRQRDIRLCPAAIVKGLSL